MQQGRCLAIVKIGLCHDAGSSCSEIKMWRMALFKADLPQIYSINYTVGCMRCRHGRWSIIVFGKGVSEGVDGSDMGSGRGGISVHGYAIDLNTFDVVQ